MGLPSFYNQTVLVTRAPLVERRGGDARDWAHSKTHEVAGCHCQPVAASGELYDRTDNQGMTARLYTPADADVALGDRVSALGQTWQVTGAPPAYPSATGTLAHREFDLARWDG